jgi:ribonuclease T2
MIRFLPPAFVVAVLLTSVMATAQDQRQDTPGQFDFYVLSLSWAPSFCAAAAERGRGRAANVQSGVRPYSFVVHGLWPQYDKGFPEYCQLPAPRLDHSVVVSMLDMMPAPHLIFNEMGSTRYLLRPDAARLFRDGAQGPRGGENSARLH